MADDSRLCDTNVLSSFHIVLSVRGVITKATAADLWHVHMALVSRPGSVSEESTGDRKQYAKMGLMKASSGWMPASYKYASRFEAV